MNIDLSLGVTDRVFKALAKVLPDNADDIIIAMLFAIGVIYILYRITIKSLTVWNEYKSNREKNRLEIDQNREKRKQLNLISTVEENLMEIFKNNSEIELEIQLKEILHFLIKNLTNYNYSNEELVSKIIEAQNELDKSITNKKK